MIAIVRGNGRVIFEVQDSAHVEAATSLDSERDEKQRVADERA